MADSSHLSQLFQNLLGNALKYSAKDRAPIVHVSAKKRIAEWLFSIKDNGIGIDMQFAERIFGPFQRLHSTEVYSGTGIGLAICKRIVDRHQGRIWIESVLDQGSTVYFTIPDYSHTEDTL
jgi:chemotaxis family two-component system sensor kinase Cph1